MVLNIKINANVKGLKDYLCSLYETKIHSTLKLNIFKVKITKFPRNRVHQGQSTSVVSVVDNLSSLK